MIKKLAISAAAITLAACTPATKNTMDVAQDVDVYGISYGVAKERLAQTNQEVLGLRDRVRRVERAMVRLDRRMQLVERNELARITALQELKQKVSSVDEKVLGQTADQLKQNIAASFKKASLQQPQQQQQIKSLVSRGEAHAQPQALPRIALQTSPFARGAAVQARRMTPMNFQPVAYQPTKMQQQAAPTKIGTPAQAMKKPSVIGVKVPVNALPSLADKSAEVQAEEKQAGVSFWTVSYAREKVWPNRDQLAGSRKVVDALRSDEKAVVFARGADTTSRRFRERVRALSRYLGRVANVDQVPISSMPANHLDTNTIEVIVSR